MSLFVAAIFAATPVLAGPSLLFDAATGEVVSQDRAGEPWYPASLTKLMTAYVTFQALKKGEVKPDTKLTCSKNAVSQAPSKLNLPVGGQITADAQCVGAGIGAAAEQGRHEVRHHHHRRSRAADAARLFRQ
jgi:D-alanyl-D-alanine carboxypeptidase